MQEGSQKLWRLPLAINEAFGDRHPTHICHVLAASHEHCSICNPSVLMSAYKQTTTRESKNKPHFVEKHNPRQLLNTNGIFGARIWKSYLGVTSLLREDSKHQNSEGKLGRKCPERKA